MMMGKQPISSEWFSVVSEPSLAAKQVTISIDSPYRGGCRVHLNQSQARWCLVGEKLVKDSRD
ncbi:hypothetical protein [Coleofasciculus sp. E2-BRE-01]|uniref:hypothetical protein n=1 Tax=Coleofasciculus sp. E2-BRE-01 TaxID=3069524 RepID=UPI0032FDBF32